jgi:hypothetical protein
MISHQLLSGYARGSGVGLGVFEKDHVALAQKGQNFCFLSIVHCILRTTGRSSKPKVSISSVKM